MNLKLKTALTLIAFTGILGAAGQEMQVRNLEKRVNALEQNKGGVINPAVNPCVKDGVNLFIRADFLWMSAREDDLLFAEHVTEDSSGAFDYEGIDMDRHWQAGFRVGLGYNMAHDGWDIQLNWMELHGKHTRDVADFTAGQAPAVVDFITPLLGDAISESSEWVEANGRWKMDLDTVDLQIGREFLVSKWLCLRPNVGLRYASINQHLHLDFLEEVGVSADTDYHTNMKCDYQALGLIIGLDTNWVFGQGFSLFGNAAISGLYGEFKTHQDNTLEVSEVESDGPDFHHNYYNGKFIADLILGLRWHHMFSHDRYGLTIQAAWESHLYFNQNQFYNPAVVEEEREGPQPQRVGVLNGGDLTVQGISVGVRFDF